MPDVFDALWMVYTAVWTLVVAGLAGVCAYRFGLSPAGIVLGGAYGLWAVKAVVMKGVTRVLLPRLELGYELDSFVFLGSQAVSMGFWLLVIVGYALIPLSLGRRPYPAGPSSSSTNPGSA